MKKLNLPPKKCLSCKKLFYRESCKQVSDFKEKKFCSKKCYQSYSKRENHPRWNGGIKHRPDGYLRDSFTGQYIHRIVMEVKLGRHLRREEQVHHINGNHSDNRIKNLILIKNGEHRKKYHNQYKRDKKGRFS